MTLKQKERIQNKIKQIRKEIYEEKKRWGGYHDGRGHRYIPFELYLQIQDFKGGLTYLRWFTKTFPEDIGMPGYSSDIAPLIEVGRTEIPARWCETYIHWKFMNRPIVNIVYIFIFELFVLTCG